MLRGILPEGRSIEGSASIIGGWKPSDAAFVSQ
jgi:hypothetical protein